VAFLPASLPLVAGAPLAGRIIARCGTTLPITVGAAAAAAGYLVCPPRPAGALDLLPTTLPVALGFVLAFVPLNVTAMAGVAARDRAAAGAFYQTAVQIGGVAALACASVLLAGGTRAALGFTAGAAVLAVSVSAPRPGRGRKIQEGKVL
jgi:predicted MFS family arabinose efflux permease